MEIYAIKKTHIDEEYGYKHEKLVCLAKTKEKAQEICAKKQKEYDETEDGYWFPKKFVYEKFEVEE